MVIAVDSHYPQPAELRQYELLKRATGDGGFSPKLLGPVMGFERQVGEYVDRMILSTKVGIPSMITRFKRDDDYPWLAKPLPEPIDYAQGEISDVIEVALKWGQQ